MRAIKFRAWNGTKLLDWDWIVAMGLTSNVVRNAENKYQVMQFTGLTDKNGKEIYEGDVVKCFDQFGVIEYGFQSCDDCQAAYGYGTKTNLILDNPEYIEVIGNIYERTKKRGGGIDEIISRTFGSGIS